MNTRFRCLKPVQSTSTWRISCANWPEPAPSQNVPLTPYSYSVSMGDNIKLYNLLDGEIPSSAIDLPPPDTKRWVTRRKAVIVNAVRTGVISLEEVCRRHELSVEEFLAWQRAIDTHGVPGLRVTRLQIYRDNPPSRLAKPRS
jgi:Protein of unknown function (DUF1153)